MQNKVFNRQNVLILGGPNSGNFYCTPCVVSVSVACQADTKLRGLMVGCLCLAKSDSASHRQ